ncbi:hypothetical protein [Alicyclobacillus fodiniaquatilis]|uniref:Uncharacterized protein n=1 Tax=Alicyclobacillus fodiniaquatilis TaxID=1661150 RepID=A0ABW4JID5_9BACL
MRIRHVGEIEVTTTITTQSGITFTNFPAKTCNCGDEVLFSSQHLDIAEELGNRILGIVNGAAVTVDYSKVNPDIIEIINSEQDEEFREMLRRNPPRRRDTGKSMEELEQLILASLPNDPDEVDCSPKSR